MKLLFDIGNTRIKWAYFSAGKIQSSASVDAKDIDLLRLQNLFKESPKPESIWMSNVGSAKVLDVLCAWADSEYDLAPNRITVTQRSCGIENKYQTQESLGVDRWLAAIGARSVVSKGDVIIIDAGTAVTIDWLSEDDNFEGGVIIPGFNLMHNALVKNTAGIKSDYTEVGQVIGRTTEECVNSGVFNGLIGAIGYVVTQMQQGIGMPTTIILTGGSASRIQEQASLAQVVQPDLVLLGVAQVAGETE